MCASYYFRLMTVPYLKINTNQPIAIKQPEEQLKGTAPCCSQIII